MSDPEKKTGGIGKGTPGPGRGKGNRNRTTVILKEAILLAAEKAGGREGLVGYLIKIAKDEPGHFCTLLGKVLPLQVTGLNDGPIRFEAISKAVSNLPDKDLNELARILEPLAAAARVAPGIAGSDQARNSSTKH